jgi:hypothetical protein
MLTDFGVSASPIVLADQGLGHRNIIACSRWQWDGDHGLSNFKKLNFIFHFFTCHFVILQLFFLIFNFI